MSVTTVSKAAAPAKDKKPVQKPKLEVVPKVIRGDTYMVLASSASEPDDEFVNLYYTNTNTGGLALKPPFDPKMLKSLVQHNNILSQCVEAMSVNIDGTGIEFISTEEDKEPSEDDVAVLKAFFDEPFPGTTQVGIRRALRDDIEAVGYGYLEILESIDETLVGFRNVEVSTMRMVRLDEPVQVTRKIMRGGKEVEMTFMTRERRFVQVLNSKTKLFYREFGATRHLNRNTGVWESDENPVDVADRATSIMMFGVNRDPNSPYFLPRWINNLPSVLGSRKAEEQNLEFFDAGGMPPAIIFIQGGAMVGNSADQLRTYLSAKNRQKGRAIVVELQSTAGTLEAGGGVTARVERFGAQQANDAMFSAYDKTVEDHVRTAFRLPPLFLGKAADYNFATAQTSYMVAEAQVFQPERTEFDSIINKTLVPKLKVTTAKIRSMPITLKSSDTQLKGLEMVKDVVSGEGFVTEVNKIVGTTMEFDQEKADQAEEQRQLMMEGMANANAAGGAAPGKKPVPGATPVGVKKPKDAESAKKMSDLAKKFAHVCGRNHTFKFDFTAEEQVAIMQEVDALEGSELAAFNRLLSAYSTVAPHKHDHH